MKFLTISSAKKRIERFDAYSSKHSGADQTSYTSISDFKPLNNLYSSVKLYEEDFSNNTYQTKKQIIKQIIESDRNRCKLEDWMIAKKAKDIHIQNYPKSEFCLKKILSYSEDALSSIRSMSFEDFCESHLKKVVGVMTLFKQKNSLKHKMDSISDSLIHLPYSKIEIAIDIFQNLLKAGGQIEAPLPTIYYVWNFVNQLFEEIEDLRQEAYFQVIKQLNSRKKIYYQVLACLSATIQPSSRMYLPLLNYIYEESNNVDLTCFSQFHNYIFSSLIRNSSNPRKAPPSMFQLYCYMNLRKVPLLINLPRESTFFIESYSTVSEMLGELIELYGLNLKTQYLLNIEGTLLEDGNIMDGLNKNKEDREDEQYAWHRFESFKGFNTSIVIKNMLEMYQSQENFLIMFNYIVSQYRRGLFAVATKLIIQIGGLIIASEVEMEDHYEFSLAKYIPKRKFSHGLEMWKKQKIEKLITEEYCKFHGTKKEARNAIIKILSSSQAFLTHFFYCNVFVDEYEYAEAWVGIKSESLMVIEPGTSRITLMVPYQKIKKWGRSSSELCLKVDNIGDLHIQCQTCDVLISIFSNYLDYLKTQLSKKNKQ